ncbi:MAG: hypothetical protein F4Y86_17800 [Gammaproteobacteria bacterium]|nr:hypothetical protein [Gammaproteobacteria bacterium]MYB38701.1 hypothetical protein [Gammaproteobacteria bacterium]
MADATTIALLAEVRREAQELHRQNLRSDISNTDHQVNQRELAAARRILSRVHVPDGEGVAQSLVDELRAGNLDDTGAGGVALAIAEMLRADSTTTGVDETCPICGLEGVDVESQDHGERRSVRCPTCGNFTITQSVVNRLDQPMRHHLSAWTRAKKETGRAVPAISSDTFDAIVSSFPSYSVTDKQRLLIEILADQTSHPGALVHLDYRSLSPRVWASGSDETYYLANALHGRGLMEFAQRSGDRTMDYCQITPAGWDYLDRIESSAFAAASSQVFVAMWFDASMESAWVRGIRPAVESAGYTPYRVDNDLSNLGRIDAKIEAEIKRSRFLIADVTGARQGVYYEAGYAVGLGLPVIWSVRSDRMADMHFDTKQYKHVIWATPEDLANQLHDLVIAAIGEPP